MYACPTSFVAWKIKSLWLPSIHSLSISVCILIELAANNGVEAVNTVVTMFSGRENYSMISSCEALLTIIGDFFSSGSRGES